VVPISGAHTQKVERMWEVLNRATRNVEGLREIS